MTPWLLVAAFAVLCIQTTWAKSVNCQAKKADILFIMDESSSIYPTPFKQQKAFITDLVSNFAVGPDGTHIALISFATRPNKRFIFKDDSAAVVNDVTAVVQGGGNTYTWLALDMARNDIFSKAGGSRLNDAKVPKIAIIITDGNSQKPEETEKAASKLRAQGVSIFAIGVGPELAISDEELLNIAGAQENIFRVEKYDELKSLENTVLNAACVTEAPPTRPPINIFSDCGNKKADVLFVMDSSENAKEDDVNGMKDFLGKLVYSFDLGTDKTRLGFINYGTSADLVFGLGDNQSHDDLFDQISGVSADGGPAANLMEALKIANQQVFNPDKGGRTRVAKALVLITSGKSSDSNQAKDMARALMRDRGVKITAIALGSADQRELASIAGSDGLIPVADAASLNSGVRDGIASKICRSRPPPNDYGCGEYIGIDLAYVMNTPNAGGYDMGYASDFMQKASAKFEIGPDKTQVSVVPAECKTLPGFPLKQYSNKVDLISAMKLKKDVSMSKLMQIATTETFTSANGARPKGNATRVIVLVTDASPDQESQAKAAQAKADGIEVFVVGVGKKVNKAALSKMASEPADTHVFTVSSYEQLVSNPRTVDGITTAICQI